MDPDQSLGSLPDPTSTGKRTFKDWTAQTKRRFVRRFTTREGLIGDYDYSYMFKPNLPFMKKDKKNRSRFFGLNDEMPVLLGMLLGLSHALAAVGGVTAPPLIMGAAANLPNDRIGYMVSCALIVSGLLTALQLARFHIHKTRYFVGTGLISYVGTSFTTITIATQAIPQMYANGYCPLDVDGNQLPCPRAYEAILGTSCLCALIEVAFSFVPSKVLQRIFPPLVTGPVVLLIGTKLVAEGMQNWAGGSGQCMARPATGLYSLCPDINAPHALPWGSPQYIGLGFSVFVTIVICERFGSQIMRSCSVIIGLIVGCIIAAACGYFDNSSITAAPVGNFLWTDAFKLRLYGPIVLPMMAVYIVITMEGIGTFTATCDVSRQEVSGPVYESRIQGGLLCDGINGVLSALANTTPVGTLAQNNGVIAMTNCANKTAGYWGCFFLVLMGVFAKFSAALVAIPSSVLGGLTTFLFCTIAVSGLRVISVVNFTARNRFVLTASLTFGFAATLVPNWFSYIFSYDGDNNALKGFLDAIVLICETGFAMAGFVGVVMNLLLEEDEEEDETGTWGTNEVEGISVEESTTEEVARKLD